MAYSIYERLDDKSGAFIQITDDLVAIGSRDLSGITLLKHETALRLLEALQKHQGWLTHTEAQESEEK